ncbi:hypothetical protein SDC9_195460 [bioreactor metagenome]|uniref:Uncharacterized protein n=1 Tax=bioreactor metagenome TaxID=1076179 RepID=A0A645IAC6_9ZZZZ
MPPGKLHRLAHRRAGRHPRKKQELIGSHPQGVEHVVLHFLRAHRGILGNIVVQQQLILQHAVAQAGGKSGVALVQGRIAYCLFQVAFRPRALPPAGRQGEHRRFSGCHGPLPPSVCAW